MDIYFGKGQTPKYNAYQLTTVGPVAVWTPAASARIVLSDVFVTNGGAAAGTFRVSFNGTSTLVLDTLGSSARAAYSPRTPWYNLNGDQSLYFEAATSESAGGWTISALGFEQN